MQDFKFKDVELTFNFKKLSFVDQDYLKTMIFNTVNNKSVKSSGHNFHEYYTNSNNFTLFKNEQTMINYMSEFVGEYSYTVSHLLEGKKYWFAWTHNKRK